MQVMVFLAADLDGIPIHLNHRDATFPAVSRAPFRKIDATKKRTPKRKSEARNPP
jgi:predicted dithiol-disulfide oxidoreductase (DUF899 family)